MKKKEKDNNNRKRQLLLALFMLIVSSITLTTASYAWFTANTNVSVGNLDVNVGASNGIQISTDATTWKATVTKEEILGAAYDGHTNQVPSSLAPVSTVGTVIQTTNGNDIKGRMKMFSGAINWMDNFNNGTPADITDDYNTYLLTAGELFDVAGTTESSAGQYIAFDLFVLVQQTETLYLASTSAVTSTSGLKNSARVAFLNEGNVAAGNSTGAIALNAATSAVIWEPNNDVHTAAAIDNNSAVYGSTIAADTALTSYYGIKTVIPKEDDSVYPNGIPYSATSATAPGSTYLGTVTPGIATGATFGLYRSVTTLSAGINKIRIYAWIEGQDVDCETTASGTDVTFSLKFSKNSAA